MFTMVGEYLRSHRQKQGLTQERLTERICAVETYSRIEKGTVNIEERFREAYLVALNLDKALTDMGQYEEGNQH